MSTMPRTAVRGVALVLLFAPAAIAQECRDATPAERLAIMRVLDTTRRVFEAPLLAGDWQIESRKTGEKAPIAIKPMPPRPLMTCQALYSVEFVMKPDSAAGKPHYAKWKAAMDSSDPTAVLGVAHDLNLVRFGIALGENMPYLREEIHSPMTRLTIPGVPIAYRVTAPPKEPGDDPVVHTYLFFGDWSAFPFDTNTYIPYRFAHPIGSPNIETLRVNISGLPEVVDPVIRHVDWAQMAAALSR